MIDILFIKKIIIFTIIGIYDWEKKYPQKLVLDIELAYNKKELDNSFVINNTSYIDYVKVKEIIFSLISCQNFNLIEDVAEIVANILIKKFCVRWVRITVIKPHAICDSMDVGICIKRISYK